MLRTCFLKILKRIVCRFSGQQIHRQLLPCGLHATRGTAPDVPPRDTLYGTRRASSRLPFSPFFRVRRCLLIHTDLLTRRWVSCFLQRPGEWNSSLPAEQTGTWTNNCLLHGTCVSGSTDRELARITGSSGVGTPCGV